MHLSGIFFYLRALSSLFFAQDQNGNIITVIFPTTITSESNNEGVGKGIGSEVT